MLAVRAAAARGGGALPRLGGQAGRLRLQCERTIKPAVCLHTEAYSTLLTPPSWVGRMHLSPQVWLAYDEMEDPELGAVVLVLEGYTGVAEHNIT